MAYEPHNDIIKDALLYAGYNSSQNTTTPPYSFTVQIAKNHLESAIQEALRDFDGLFGLMRTHLKSVEIEEGLSTWEFAPDPDFLELHLQYIKKIYLVNEHHTELATYNWHYQSFKKGEGPSAIYKRYIVIDAPAVPDLTEGTQLFCDYVYLVSPHAPDQPLPSAGYDARFADYAAVLLGSKIATGMSNFSRSNDLLIQLATMKRVRTDAANNRAQATVGFTPGPFQSMQ